jgi:hypothetical protein
MIAPNRHDVVAWNESTSDLHPRYRDRFAPSGGSVAVVCVSNRSSLVDRVVANVERQGNVVEDLIYVASVAIDDTVEQRLAAAGSTVTRVEVIRAEGVSLGAGLNLGMNHTDARFVAKFDDDDHYGAQYLSDALRAHRYAGAGVVGKHTYYAHLDETDEWVLRFPAHEFAYSSTLAGGTLVIDREHTGHLEFEDVSLGEDRAFVATCHRNGISTFSADRFNFVQSRGCDNTWQVSREHFLERSLLLDVDGDEPSGPHVIDR